MFGTFIFWGLIYLGLGLGWYGFSAYQFRRASGKTNGNWFRTWPLQWTVIAILSVFIVCVADDEPFWVVAVGATIIFPPFALFLLLQPIISSFVLPLAAIVMAPLALWRETRKYAPLWGFAISLGLTPFTIDLYWDRAMCASAAELGLTNIQRPPFRHNLARVGEKSGLETYAIAMKGDEIWDWGYSAERFVRYRGDIPAWADMSGFEPLECDGVES